MPTVSTLGREAPHQVPLFQNLACSSAQSRSGTLALWSPHGPQARLSSCSGWAGPETTSSQRGSSWAGQGKLVRRLQRQQAHAKPLAG